MIHFNLLYTEEDYRILNIQNVVEYNHVLDYAIVKNKLTKVDYLKKTPSDSVVSYYMYKKLSQMVKEEKDGGSILWILKSLNSKLLDDVKAVIENLCEVYGKEFDIKVLAKTKTLSESLKTEYNILDLNE